jgi:hypothetical protein
MSESNPKQPAPQGDSDPMATDHENAEQQNAELGNLDEAWAGLAQLLNANAVPLNQAALVNAICRRMARRRLRRQQVVLALAASLLVAVGGTWVAMSRRVMSRNDTQVVVLPSGKLSSNSVPPSENVTVGPQAKPAALTPATEKAAPSVWNDDWDDELAQTQEEVLATEEGWRQPTDWLATVRERMDELEAEFGEGAL